MSPFAEPSHLLSSYDLHHKNPTPVLDLAGHKAPQPWLPTIPVSPQFLGGLANSGGCMEKLLVHCANAIESNDVSLAQQIIWVLNNIAPPNGDSNQRLTSCFLRALIARASRMGNCKLLAGVVSGQSDQEFSVQVHRFTAVVLANFIDLTPWHRFGYCAANAAIVEAVEGFSVVHIVNITTTHCMQIPTLIEALAVRPEGPPLVRLTVPISTAMNPPPPILDMSYDELGSRLVNFARSRNVMMEFKAIPSDPTDAFDSLIEHLRLQQLVSEGEALVVNCQMLLHQIPEESSGAVIAAADSTPPFLSLRTIFLKSIRTLDPVLVTLVEEDIDLVAPDVVGRLRSAFNYLWIPLDAVDTFLPKESEKRRWYEAEVEWKVENLIAQEGLGRVERQEGRSRWGQRMRSVGFRGAAFGDEAVGEVKGLLDEHAAGWGLKKEEDDLVLCWKGHNVVFASAWLPSSPTFLL